MSQTISEKIRQRRRQMFVHSYIYYELNQNIVSDSTWSKWAVELAELQQKYPKESAEVEYADDFKDWDGSSGAFLKFPDFVSTVANHLLSLHNNKKSNFTEKMQKSALNCKAGTKKVKLTASRKLF